MTFIDRTILHSTIYIVESMFRYMHANNKQLIILQENELALLMTQCMLCMTALLEYFDSE